MIRTAARRSQLNLGGSRSLFSTGAKLVEDAVYLGLGILLAGTALCMLFIAIRTFVTALAAGSLPGQIIDLLGQTLLILLILELLYTVEVSFREHSLVPEPFLVVALIATVRKVLVLTAQAIQVSESNELLFRHTLAQLGLLSLMVLVLVGSLVLLQRHSRGSGSAHTGVMAMIPGRH